MANGFNLTIVGSILKKNKKQFHLFEKSKSFAVIRIESIQVATKIDGFIWFYCLIDDEATRFSERDQPIAQTLYRLFNVIKRH